MRPLRSILSVDDEGIHLDCGHVRPGRGKVGGWRRCETCKPVNKDGGPPKDTAKDEKTRAFVKKRSPAKWHH
jgi:hypothetical protein